MRENQEPTNQVQRSCPLCEGRDADLFMEKGSLRLTRCRACSMIYANPVEAELASGRFYDRLGAPFYLSPDKLESDYAPVRFKRELRFFRAHCRAGAVLDIGCSTGAFLFQLKTLFPGDYTVTGMDVASAALDYAEGRGIQVVRDSFLDFDFGARRFDAVTFWAVIEHLVRPRGFLSRAGSVLKPGGHCFVLVPNLKSLAARWLGVKYRYLMPDHVNYFTASTLERFAAEEAGFEIVRLTQSHFNPAVILKDVRGGVKRVADEERARLLKRTTALKQHPLLRPAQWIYSATERLLVATGLADNLVMVMRKKF
jgi:2-polyprenyl-3-methyl-5-hydroxy-6-metoxy-1,4-benzoquinol methylase